MRGSSFLELVGLTKRYGTTTAVDNVSVDVAKGELVTLLGPSGSGKTTVLRMIAGFATPDSGDIILEGNRINDVSPEKRNMGFVFQSYALFPHMQVQDNIAFPLVMRHLESEEIKRKVKAIMESLGLDRYEGRYPKQLSGGEQQRVALARALVFEPSLLLLDEPLSALDQKLRVQLRAELKSIQRELRVTTVFVTHDQEEAFSMSNWVAVLQSGRLEQFDDAKEIYEKPATKFVAEFVGTTNIVEGRVKSKSPGIVSISSGRIEFALHDDGRLKQGDEVSVAIRAERVRVSKARGDGVNIFEGKLEDVTFMGQTYMYVVELAGGLRLKSIDFQGRHPLDKNQRSVYVSWEPEDGLVVRG